MKGLLIHGLVVLALGLPAMGPATAADGKEPVAEAGFDYDELRIEFAEPMQAWGNEERGDVVALHPAVPVRCNWSDDTVLSCMPAGDGRFPAATRYRISIAAGLALQTGERLPALVLAAETVRPTVRAAVGEWNKGIPWIEVSSDAEVEGSALAAVLRLSVDGAPVDLPPLRLLSPRGSWDTDSRFALELPALEGRDRRVGLSVVPGLRSSEGPLRGTEDRTLLEVVARERFHLRGASCGGAVRDVDAPVVDGRMDIQCMPAERVALLLSSAPDEASRTAFADALPAGVRLLGWEDAWSLPRHWPRVRGDDAVRERGQWINLGIDAAGAEVSLSAALANLRADRDGIGLEQASVVIRTGDHRPVFVAPRQQALVADGRQPPPMAAAINARSPFRVRVSALADGGSQAEVLDVAAATTNNAPHAIDSAATALALSRGGWARWETPRPPEYWRSHGEVIEFAAPGFDLVAVSGRHEVLARAGAWEDGSAIAGARLELLLLRDEDSQPEVVARATTGTDGVARMRLPAGFDPGAVDRNSEALFPIWLLRAEAGRGAGLRRTVLPLGAAARYDMRLGRKAPTRTWGVVDRPLYRAGDTVRYRLWQRSVEGGRLVGVAGAGPREIGLHDQDEHKLIKTWPVEPAADGSVEGEIVLPAHLSDAIHCIGTGERWNVEGACFFVGTYRAQDLWVEARAEDPLLRDGDLFTVELEAGYYSGGVAAGVPVPSVTAMLQGRRLEDEYPRYSDFTFVDAMGDDARAGIALERMDLDAMRTGADGRLRIEQPVAFGSRDTDEAPELPAFGRLQLVAEARLADREGTASNAATARYARHDRYVGLRLHPRWLDAQVPVEMEAVVVAADGSAIERAPVRVEVHYLPGFGDDDEARAEALASCDLVAGEARPCAFPRLRNGRYRMTARSGDAAPAEIIRYIHAGGRADSSTAVRAVLELQEAPAAAGDPVRVLLRQPHDSARVLFVFSSGDAILGHRVEELTGTAGSHVLKLPDSAARSLSLTAYVLDAAAAVVEDGWRVPRPVTSSSIEVPLPMAMGAPAPLAVAFSADAARPGDVARITLRNDDDAARDVVLAVVDDALRALGSDILEYFDPEGRHWLGALREDGHPRLAEAAFGNWSGRDLRLPLPWPDAALAQAVDGRAPDAAGDAAALPPPPGEPPVVFDDPSPMSVPAPPPAPPAPAPASFGQADSALDRIEVTGSRIQLADVFHAGPTPDRGLRPRDTGAGEAVRQIARVRTAFADTALWRSGIRLAPGEEIAIDVVLPDNLTRWRAVAWSSDADDGFHMAEAVLETGLPLEVRLQAPVRIYPGDAARLAANLRHAGDDDVIARGSLSVEGMAAPLSHAEDLSLVARGQGSFALELAPTGPGSLLAVAFAEGAGERDAVAASIEVASPLVETRKLQAGWLQDADIVLDVPELPASASGARLGVRLLHGVDALVKPWTHDLHEYPHRCWEQILSRAVAAALAIERGDVEDWPDAQAVVQEALDNAAVFQDDEGGFRFFAGSQDDDFSLGQVQASRMVLAAYTVRVFDLLRDLGHAVPGHVDERARRYLARGDRWNGAAPLSADISAFAAAARARAGAGSADALWDAWSTLSLPARIAATRVLAEAGHPARTTAVADLLALAPRRGVARVLSLPRAQGLDPWMSSRLREQCALVELLGDHPRLAPADVRRSLVAGLRNLYAGGVDKVDTQAGAQCLMALRDLALPSARAGVVVAVDAGGDPVQMVLPADESSVERSLPLADGQEALRIAPEALPPGGASYVAELRYQEDAREARASAVGLSIERRHEVLRDGAWRAVQGETVHEGDWLRVTLVVHTSATRHYVALTDAVPGGLRPTDLALGGIAGLDLAKVSDEGSGWFRTRRLDPRSPKFYAEWLPAGRHEVHYFARAGNAGDYLAAPAVAELMYGDASHARTAAGRLRIVVGGD